MNRTFGVLSRLLIAVVVAGVVAGVAGTLVLRAYAHDALERQIESRDEGLALRLAVGLDDRIRAYAATLRLLAADRSVVRMDEGAVSELNVALRVREGLEQIVVFDLDGRAVAAASTRELLRPAEVASGSLRLLAEARSDPPAVGLPEGERAVDIAVPIEDPPGTVVGVVVGRVPFASVATRVETGLLSTASVGALVDDTGRYVHHPNPELVREGVTVSLPIVGDEGGVTRIVRGGEDLLLAAWPTSLFPGAVVVEVPAAVALAPVGRTILELTVILLGVVGTIVIAVAVVGRRLLRPLEPLGQAVTALAAGDRSARAPEEGAGEVKALAVAFNEMTDALDEQIREVVASRRRLQDILDNTPAVVTVKDLDGRYLLVNRHFERVHGRAKSDVVGTVDGDGAVRTIEEEIIATGEWQESEHVVRRPDGDRHHHVLRFPLNDDAGQPYAVCAIETDITERRQVEEVERELEEARRSRQQALEINDDIVQGLALALTAFDLGEDDAGKRAVEETITAARSLISRLLRDAGTTIGPSDLIRTNPSTTRRSGQDP